MLKIYLAVCVFFSLLAALFFKIDKSRAVKGRARFPELTLLTLAALGGAAGAFVTMRAVRHKTDIRKKPHFVIGVPILLLIQVAAAVLLLLATVAA